MRPDICEETEQAMSEEDNWLVERIKELQQENAELKARDRLHTAMFADADTCLKLKQQVLQYSRERAEANRAELEAKQRIRELERRKCEIETDLDRWAPVIMRLRAWFTALDKLQEHARTPVCEETFDEELSRAILGDFSQQERQLAKEYLRCDMPNAFKRREPEWLMEGQDDDG